MKTKSLFSELEEDREKYLKPIPDQWTSKDYPELKGNLKNLWTKSAKWKTLIGFIKDNFMPVYKGFETLFSAPSAAPTPAPLTPALAPTPAPPTPAPASTADRQSTLVPPTPRQSTPVITTPLRSTVAPSRQPISTPLYSDAIAGHATKMEIITKAKLHFDNTTGRLSQQPDTRLNIDEHGLEFPCSTYHILRHVRRQLLLSPNHMYLSLITGTCIDTFSSTPYPTTSICNIGR